MEKSKCGKKLTRDQNPKNTKVKEPLVLLKNIPQYAKIHF